MAELDRGVLGPLVGVLDHPSGPPRHQGHVQGVSVRCLTPEVQVLCHAHGYVPTEKDFRDMELLRARFGVELPPNLRREKV